MAEMVETRATKSADLSSESGTHIQGGNKWFSALHIHLHTNGLVNTKGCRHSFLLTEVPSL